MKYIIFLLLHASLANMLQLDVGTEPGLPSCASRCMVDSMFVTPCLDMNCLCHTKEYQRSLFQCLYSQCDPNDYGPSLGRTIAVCMAAGAEIHMVAPGTVDHELLRAREADYLAGRQTLPEVPGLQLRQESVGGGGDGGAGGAGGASPMTVTTTVTELVTQQPQQQPQPQDVSSSPAITPFVAPSPITPAPDLTATSSPDRPWMITRSGSSRPQASSFLGLVLCFAFIILQDYWINGY
ncbi:hypothetical protein F5X99DRAFT_430051 [Biscogniauxia marginata]|nr:hypothetical protein F5X99DRAFT_430051 [Biscogniauxia marginata]